MFPLRCTIFAGLADGPMTCVHIRRRLSGLSMHKNINSIGDTVGDSINMAKYNIIVCKSI